MMTAKVFSICLLNQLNIVFVSHKNVYCTGRMKLAHIDTSTDLALNLTHSEQREAGHLHFNLH